MNIKTNTDYEFTFVKVDDAWWLKINDQLDLNHYRSKFMREQFAKAAVNILEGKEYRAIFTMGHGPFQKMAPLSDLALYQACTETKIDIAHLSTAQIMSRLGYIYNQKIMTFQTMVKNKIPFYVNQSGGYNAKFKPKDIQESLNAKDFPEPNTKTKNN